MTSQILRLILVAAFAATAAIPARACIVPVFRYSLENWQPETFELAIMTPKAPDAEQAKLIEALRALSYSGGGMGNFEVWEFQQGQELPAWAADIWGEEGVSESKPAVALVDLASSSDPVVVGRSALDAASLSRLIDSPVRREIARSILTGAPFVWVLLEGTDKERNATMERLIPLAMDAAREEVEFPDTEEMLNDPERPQKPMSPLPLELRTSIVRISPGDVRESGWIDHLYVWEKESRPPPTEPSLFVAFGQGRVLGPISAKEVENGSLSELIRFMAGPCSCQVKSLNPGFDVVMMADWNLVFQDKPDLTRLGVEGHPLFDPPAEQVPSPSAATAVADRSSGAVFVAAGAFVLAAVAVVAILRHRRRR